MPDAWICRTCGTQFEPTPTARAACPICEDERQYVGWEGQRWTTGDELARERRIRFDREADVDTLRIDPDFAIGQRAFLIPDGTSNVLWECLSLVTPEAVARIEALGGLTAIAISHPHFYAAMVDWSDAFGGVPIYLHEADRAWVQRHSPSIRFWNGDRLSLSGDLELVRLPGHFPGSAGLWWKSGPTRGGSLFPGDALQVVADRRHVTFMYSYPNGIPLRPSAVRRLRGIVAPLAFADAFGYARGRQIVGDAKAAVERSFARFLSAVAENS